VGFFLHKRKLWLSKNHSLDSHCVNVCSLVGSPMNFCESCKFIPPIPISNTTAKELQCDTVKEDMGVRLRSFEVYGLCQMSSCFGFRWFPLVCLCGDARARTFGQARTHASPFPASTRFVCPHEARVAWMSPTLNRT
jgi:hypothetical protein